MLIPISDWGVSVSGNPVRRAGGCQRVSADTAGGRTAGCCFLGTASSPNAEQGGLMGRRQKVYVSPCVLLTADGEIVAFTMFRFAWWPHSGPCFACWA